MKKHSFYYRDKTKNSCNNLLYLKNFKLIKKNFNIKNTIRQKTILKCYQKNNRLNIIKLKKYCILTGRLRFIISKYKYNRINFRELVSKNYLPGMYKK